MIALSFRIKLMLGMLLLVGGVTGATLFATQNKVQATYLKLFQDQFESEVNYFTIQQEARLSPAKQRCLELAKLPAMRTALQNGNTDGIYEVATNFLNLSTLQIMRAGRENFRNGGKGGGPGGGGLNLLRNNTSFFRVVNAQGQILHLPEPHGRGFKQAARERLETQLAAVQNSISTLEEQPVGYLAPERTNGTIELLEMIVTKVADADTNQTLGALVLGVPFFETSEKAMSDMSRGGIESGIWLDHRLYSRTIPDVVAAEFEKLVAPEIQAGQTQGTLDATLGGIPRRIFFKWMNPDSPFPPAYQVSIYSLSGAYRTQAELRWQILGFGTIAFAVALFFSLLIAHGLSIPLRELVRGTKAVRAGDFGAQVPVRSRDEVGELAASFNEMTEGLVQKERYRTILNMVADEKVAHALVNGQLALGGELREISVLFCDIRGFSAYTETMPPEDVIDMLNEHMTALNRVVKEHHGVLDKFVGDLLMAIFGAPVSHENDTLNSAACAMKLIEERERLNAISRHQLQMGIGIATGKVVAGCMGSADRLNYTVLGERVNLASRLCSQAGPGQILIDQTTREKLGEKIGVVKLPSLNLKGFSDNIVAYELTSVKAGQE